MQQHDAEQEAGVVQHQLLEPLQLLGLRINTTTRLLCCRQHTRRHGARKVEGQSTYPGSLSAGRLPDSRAVVLPVPVALLVTAVLSGATQLLKTLHPQAASSPAAGP